MDATGSLWGPLLDALGDPRGDRGVRALSYPDDVTSYGEVLEHLGTPERGTVVVAESFSGPAAIRLALAHPDRVRALVLVATFAHGSRALLWLGPLIEASLSIRPPALAIRALMVGTDAPPELVERVRGAIARVPPATLFARVRAAAAADVRPELAALRMPIVWVRARHDRLVPARATREAQRARPGLDVRVVDGPHLLAQARPRAIAEPILALGRA